MLITYQVEETIIGTELMAETIEKIGRDHRGLDKAYWSKSMSAKNIKACIAQMIPKKTVHQQEDGLKH